MNTIDTCQTIWTPVNSVDRCSNISYEDFIQNYVAVGKPAIITGLMEDWTARKHWSYDFFQDEYGSRKCQVRDCADKRYIRTTFAEFMNYMKSGDRDRLLYLVGHPIYQEAKLFQDYPTPIYFPDWMDRLPKFLAYPFWTITKPLRWLFIGPKGCSSGKLHYEMWGSSGWVGMISGRKRFVFFSPDQSDVLYNGQVDIFNPDLDKFPLYAKAKPIEAIVEAGDIIYAPPLWWHQVENLEDSISITHDFINEWNSKLVFSEFAQKYPLLGPVLPFLLTHPLSPWSKGSSRTEN